MSVICRARRGFLALILSSALFAYAPPVSAQSAPDKISDFLNGFGINSHIQIQWSTDYPYTLNAANQAVFSQQKLTNFENAVQYLGVHTLRDVVTNDPLINNAFPGPGGVQGLSMWQKVNQDIGAKFVFTTTGENGSLANLEQNANVISAVEGPNEVDDGNWFVFLEPNGTRLTGIPAAEMEQPIIYNTIKQTSTPAGLPVIQYSLGNPADFAQAGTVTALDADYGNAHIYFGTGNPPGSGNVALLQNDGLSMTPGKPVYVTETGYATMENDVGSVSPAVQAQYELSDLLDNWSQGARNILLYEISDYWPDPTGTTSREYHFGVFNDDWTPKPAAIALHNMTSLLQDSSAVAGTLPPVLTYTLGYSTTPVRTYLATPRTTDGTTYWSQAPAIKSHLFQKNDGTFILALWNDNRLSDSVQQIDITVPPVQVLVSLNEMASQIEIFDPLIGTAPTISKQNLQGLTVAVPSHPIFLFVSVPLAMCGTQPSGSTYALPLSQTPGSTSATAAQCPYGGTQGTLVTATQTYLCTNGVQSAVGSPVSTSTITGAPSCNLPLSCGATPNGQTVWVNGTTGSSSATASQAACPQGGTVTTTWTNQSQQLCTNGQLSATGQTQQVNLVTASAVCQSAIDTPSVQLPAALSVPAGLVTAIPGIMVTDQWAQTQPGSMILNITAGNGLVSTSGHPAAAKAIQVKGTLAQLNAQLASLLYTAPTAVGATDHLGINPWNQAGHAVQAYSLITTVTPVDVPSVTLPATVSVTAGSVTSITGISITDPWAKLQSGVMILNITTGSGMVSTSSQPVASKAIEIKGSLAQLNAQLATLKYTAVSVVGAVDHLGINPWNQAGHSVQAYTLVTTTK